MRYHVNNPSRESSLGDNVELAETSMTRFVGLLGRRGLDAGGGLWIRPSSGVHTFFMMFPIDVIGLDKDLKVVKLWHSLPPWRVTSVSLKIQSVVELPGGTIKAAGTQVGDRLEIVPAAVELPA